MEKYSDTQKRLAEFYTEYGKVIEKLEKAIDASNPFKKDNIKLDYKISRLSKDISWTTKIKIELLEEMESNDRYSYGDKYYVTLASTEMQFNKDYVDKFSLHHLDSGITFYSGCANEKVIEFINFINFLEKNIKISK